MLAAAVSFLDTLESLIITHEMCTHSQAKRKLFCRWDVVSRKKRTSNHTASLLYTLAPLHNSALCRSHILRSSRRLKQAISAPEFVKLYGKPEHGPQNKQRQNIFGREDELKVAPKGIDKNHKYVIEDLHLCSSDVDHRDIELLKCRSFAVSHM